MKWPSYLMLIRHDRSAYNILKEKKGEHPTYKKFLAAWGKNPESTETKALADKVRSIFALKISDAGTPLAPQEGHQAEKTGRQLRKKFDSPDVIFVSPYNRAILTLKNLKKGWPELRRVEVFKDERIREQEHGLSLLYNDWRVFNAFHPEQRMLRKQEGPYWYRYPQGENVPDVRLRNKDWIATLIREFSNKKVLAITHHLNILALRSNLERFDAEEFIRLDKEEKPINCGVTLYKGYPSLAKDGKLKLEFYNRKYY